MKKIFFLPGAQSSPALTFDGPWLAPLAGYSDLPFRLLCRKYGATVAETEMISAKGLVYRSPGTGELLLSAPADQPLVVQLFGSEPAVLGEAVLLLRKAGYNFFDLNMGCPVRKVLKQKSGAALMADFDRAIAIARAMFGAGRAIGPDLPDTPAKFGFKLRLSPDRSIGDFGKALEDLGAAWLTLHPRTASQGYSGKADWGQIFRLVEMVQIPVIASGDLLTAQAGLDCLKKTGAATVMYARGALHNPWIFRQHNAQMCNDPVEPVTGHLMKEVIRTHVALARTGYNQPRAFAKMRSIIPRYVKGITGIREFRANLCMCTDWQSLEETIDQFWMEAECR